MKTLQNLTLLLLALVVSQSAMAWGKWGHRISAYIAEQHLTEKANSECRRYLKHTLPYHASWQDYWRNCKGFGEVCTAHSHYVDHNFNLYGKGGNPDRDPVTRIDKIMKQMEKGQYLNMPDSIVAMNLKLLIHMTTDMHCPGHVTYPKDMKFPTKKIIKIGGKKTARHRFWDAAPMFLHPKWRIEQFAKAYDTYSEKEIKKFCKGNPYKWGQANARKMVETFDYWDEGEEFKKMSKERRQVIEDMTHKQLAVGGYRLAYILNRIFK
jgi:hypothetical protein